MKVMEQFISIRFRKIQYTGCEIKKVTFYIKAGSKKYFLSSSRQLKNGFTNLYGEALQIPKTISQFIINIIDPSFNKIIAQFIILKDVINQFSKRVNAFTSENHEVKLFWQATILSDNSQHNNGLGRSLSQTSLSDLDFQFQSTNIPQKVINRQNKQLQNTEDQKPRKKKNSMKIRISDTVSQPEKQHKKNRINFSGGKFIPTKNLRARQSDSFEVLVKSLDFDANSQIKKTDKMLEINEQLPHLVFKHEEQMHNKIFQKQIYYCPKPYRIKNILQEMPIQNNYNQQKLERKLHRHRSQIFTKINFKSMVVAGSIGVLSGLFAGHIS